MVPLATAGARRNCERRPLLVVGLPPILLAFVVLMTLPNEPHKATWLTTDEAPRIEQDIEAGNLATGAVSPHNPWAAIKNKRVWLLASLFLAFALTGYGLGLWLPQIIKNMGVSNFATGWLSTLPWIAATITLLTIPRRAEKRRSPFAHIAVSLSLAAIGLTLSVLLANPWLHMAALCLATFGIFAGQPIFWGLPSQILTGATAAAGLALINTVGATGGFLGQHGVGYISDATGSAQYGLLFLAAFAVYGLVMLIFCPAHAAQARRRTRRHQGNDYQHALTPKRPHRTHPSVREPSQQAATAQIEVQPGPPIHQPHSGLVPPICAVAAHPTHPRDPSPSADPSASRPLEQ